MYFSIFFHIYVPFIPVLRGNTRSCLLNFPIGFDIANSNSSELRRPKACNHQAGISLFHTIHCVSVYAQKGFCFLCFLLSVCACVSAWAHLHRGECCCRGGRSGEIYSIFFLDLCCGLNVCVTPAKNNRVWKT